MINIHVLAKQLGGRVSHNRIYLNTPLPRHEQQAHLDIDFEREEAVLSVYTLTNTRTPSRRLLESQYSMERLARDIQHHTGLIVTMGVAK
jgi:hypothetical protein